MRLTEKVFYTYLFLAIVRVGNCIVERYKNNQKLITRNERDAFYLLLFVTVFIGILRIFLALFYKTQKTSLHTQCVVNKYIGHVGILLVSLMTKASMYFDPKYFGEESHKAVICIVIPIFFVFYFLFAARTEKHCHIESSTLLNLVNIGHLAFCLLFVSPVAFIKFLNPNGMKYMILSHLEMFPLCAVSCREVAAVLSNALVMKKKDLDQLEDVKVEKEIEKEAMEQKKEEVEEGNTTIYKPLMVFVCA